MYMSQVESFCVRSRCAEQYYTEPRLLAPTREFNYFRISANLYPLAQHIIPRSRLRHKHRKLTLSRHYELQDTVQQGRRSQRSTIMRTGVRT